MIEQPNKNATLFSVLIDNEIAIVRLTSFKLIASLFKAIYFSEQSITKS